MSVEVTVLFFAQAKELAKKQKAVVTVPSHILCFQLLDKIVENFSLHEIKNNIILAINEEFCNVSDTLVLQQGDEVAVIPPLSGG